MHCFKFGHFDHTSKFCAKISVMAERTTFRRNANKSEVYDENNTKYGFKNTITLQRYVITSDLYYSMFTKFIYEYCVRM